MTTEKQQTPLQKHIERLSDLLEKAQDPAIKAILHHNINDAESLLPEEKQMVKNAYDTGHVDGDSMAWCYKDQDGEQYFNETFHENK